MMSADPSWPWSARPSTVGGGLKPKTLPLGQLTPFLVNGSHMPAFIDACDPNSRFPHGLACGYCGAPLESGMAVCRRCQARLSSAASSRRPDYYSCQSSRMWYRDRRATKRRPVTLESDAQSTESSSPPPEPEPQPQEPAPRCDFFFSSLTTIRNTTKGFRRSDGAHHPDISRVYRRFLVEGPRRGDGCFAKDPVETAVGTLHAMLNETRQHQRVVKLFCVKEPKPTDKREKGRKRRR